MKVNTGFCADLFLEQWKTNLLSLLQCISFTLGGLYLLNFRGSHMI